MRIVTWLAAALVLAFLGMPKAMAQGGYSPDISTQDVGEHVGKQRWVVGALIGYNDKPLEDYDDDEKWLAFPLLVYEGERFFIRANQLGVKLTPDHAFKLDVLAKFNGLDAYDSSDSDFLQGMDDRDPAFEAGAQVTWSPQPLGFGARALAVADVSSEYDGWNGRAEVFYRQGNQKWVMTYTGGLIYQSDDYTDYYFGVRNSEALPGRPAYSPDEALNYRLAGTLLYQFDRPWTLIAHLEYQFLDDEIDDSPITDDDGRFIGVIGFGYRF